MLPITPVHETPAQIETHVEKKQRIETTVAMPKAKQIRYEHCQHGDVRVDNYQWMREKGPDLEAHLDDWNTYTKQQLEPMKPFTDKVYEEFMGRIEHDSKSVPYKNGEYYYYIRMEKGREHEIYCRTHGLDGPEEILLDVNEEAEKYDYLNVAKSCPSPDGKYIIYGYDTDGSQFGTLYIQEVGKEGFHEVSFPDSDFDVEWNARSDGFWYVTHDENKASKYVYHHKMGETQKDDVLYFTEEEESFNVGILQDKLQRYILINSYCKNSSETRYGDLNHPHPEFKVIKPRSEDYLYHIIPGDGEHFVLVTANKKNAKLMRVSGEDFDPEKWVEFLATDDQIEIEQVAHHRHHLAITTRERGLPKLRFYDKTDDEWHYIDLPQEIGSVGIIGIQDYDSQSIRYVFSSPVTPDSTYEFDTSEHSMVLLKQKKAGDFDPSQFTARRIFARADDGTEIPMSIFHKKGIELDGTNSFFLYGYGSYGYSIDPNFSIITPSFVERDVICAIAHIRGGGYFGRPWYEEGKLLKKKNTFTDFINCAEHVIKDGYTSPENLVIRGASAGGLLMGAVLNARPDLFKAALVQVPFVDVLTTMLDTKLPLTKEEWPEWGNPEEEEFYYYMKSYSPVDGIEAQRFPALYVEGGLNDAQVQIHEPAKWVAKLLDYKTDDNPILFEINKKAGHHGASGRYEAYAENAPRYAFLLDQLGFKE
ncbi:MAG: Dipeptidyl aminopeptidase BI [Chlamydiae bacterium]|nr:Dipeptidyl aminopeptidase BI [Chlamydiota bacterium]